MFTLCRKTGPPPRFLWALGVNKPNLLHFLTLVAYTGRSPHAKPQVDLSAAAVLTEPLTRAAPQTHATGVFGGGIALVSCLNLSLGERAHRLYNR